MAALTQDCLSTDFPMAQPLRTQLDVLTAQVDAIDAWTRAYRRVAQAAADTGLTREMRLDLSRRTEARRREQEALLAHVDAQLRDSVDTFPSAHGVRGVIAHRSAWVCEKVAARLQAHGVEVVGVFHDGAQAAGTIVAEQPDVVLIEDRLPTLPGLDVVRRVRDFSPLTVVGAQVGDGNGIPQIADAGAHAVFTRRIPPTEMADQLVACLVGGSATLTMA